MENNRRDKEMEIKMKEKVNTKSFTFKKRVLEEAIELLGRRRNYVTNDIYFITMICFLNNMVENNLIVETLAQEGELEQNMIQFVEPLFESEIVAKEDVLTDYEDLVSQLIDYMEREVYNRTNAVSLFYDLTAELSELTQDEVKTLIQQVLQSIQQNILKPEQKHKDEQVKQEVKQDIEDLKMKALIEKFQRESVQDKNAE